MMRGRKSADFMTPMELFLKYPFVEKYGWSATKIGIFFHAELLVGYLCHTDGKKAMILEASFIELLNRCDVVREEKKILY